MPNSISRREFIGSAVASGAVLGAADVGSANALPTRVLGRTGARPSVLALGCGSRLLAYETQQRGVEAVNLALDSGFAYLDTAQAYGAGKSETWVGEVMKTRRKEVFLATKTQARTHDDVLGRFEESLKRLQVDHVDLLHIHSLGGPEDLEGIEKNRVMEALYRLRDEKAARFIGVTSHTDPETLAKALDRHDFDCTQMALNAALQGMQNGQGKMILNPAAATSFERVALPVARRENLGVIAMKVFGQEEILPASNPEQAAERLLQYSLSLDGVAVAVVGCPKHDFIRRNTASARAFKPMPPAEMKRFSDEMSDRFKQALDLKFQDHVDV